MTREYGKDILEQTKLLVELLEENKTNIPAQVARRLEIEEEIVDIYHIIELEKMDAPRRSFILSELKKVLVERRYNKESLKVANAINKVASPISEQSSGLVGRLKQLVNAVEVTNEHMDAQKYRPRRRFDLFNPEADYVKVTPQFKSYLNAQKEQADRLVDSIIEKFGDKTPAQGELTDEKSEEVLVITQDVDMIITQEIAEKFVDLNTHQSTGEDVRLATEEEAVQILDAQNESSNLVYQTKPEPEEEVLSPWKKLLNFGKKRG